MKKVLCLALAVVLCLSVFVGCSKKDKTEDDFTYIKNKGTLIIGITEFPPMNYYDESGKMTGFETEFAEAVCAKLGVTPEFQVITWGNKEIELKGKTIDVVWNGMTIRESLAENMDFSTPYMSNQQVLVVRAADADAYTTAEAVSAAKTCAEEGSAGEDYIKNNALDANYVALNSQADALLEVKAGTSDVAVLDALMAEYLVRADSDYSDLAIVYDIGLDYDTYEEYGIGIRKDSTLKAEIDKAIEELAADGTLDAIAEKYGIAERLLVG